MHGANVEEKCTDIRSVFAPFLWLSVLLHRELTQRVHSDTVLKVGHWLCGLLGPAL